MTKITCPSCDGTQLVGGQACRLCHKGFIMLPTPIAALPSQNGLVGKKVRFNRPLQGRVLLGEITEKLINGRQNYYICDFGPDEFLELCVEAVGNPGWLQVTASGALIEVVND